MPKISKDEKAIALLKSGGYKNYKIDDGYVIFDCLGCSNLCKNKVAPFVKTFAKRMGCRKCPKAKLLEKHKDFVLTETVKIRREKIKQIILDSGHLFTKFDGNRVLFECKCGVSRNSSVSTFKLKPIGNCRSCTTKYIIHYDLEGDDLIEDIKKLCKSVGSTATNIDLEKGTYQTICKFGCVSIRPKKIFAKGGGYKKYNGKCYTCSRKGVALKKVDITAKIESIDGTSITIDGDEVKFRCRCYMMRSLSILTAKYSKMITEKCNACRFLTKEEAINDGKIIKEMLEKDMDDEIVSPKYIYDLGHRALLVKIHDRDWNVVSHDSETDEWVKTCKNCQKDVEYNNTRIFLDSVDTCLSCSSIIRDDKWVLDKIADVGYKFIRFDINHEDRRIVLYKCACGEHVDMRLDTLVKSSHNLTGRCLRCRNGASEKTRVMKKLEQCGCKLINFSFETRSFKYRCKCLNIYRSNPTMLRRISWKGCRFCSVTKGRRCEKCLRFACYGKDEDDKAIRCYEHKDDNHVLVYRCCVKDGCRNIGTHRLNKTLYCKSHKPRGSKMVTKICSTVGCILTGSYWNGKKKNIRKSDIRYYCHEHKTDESYNRHSYCTSCNMSIVTAKKYNGLCKHCNPDAYKKKREYTVIKYLKKRIDKPFVSDKSTGGRLNLGPCGRYRPDMLYDCGTHFLVVEIDEEQHMSYGILCENARMLQIHESLGMRVVFLRYNPSKFTIGTRDGRVSEEKRLERLGDEVDTWFGKIPKDEITAIKMFYDCESMEDSVCDWVWTTC
jgi:hypothetical protein